MILLEHTERVPTPFGPIPAGHLRAGDPVLDSDGQPAVLSHAEPVEAELMPVRLRNNRAASSSVIWLAPDQPVPVMRWWTRKPHEDWEAGNCYHLRADQLDSKPDVSSQPVGSAYFIGAEPPAEPYALGLYLANVRRDGTLRVWTKALPWFMEHLPSASQPATRGIWSTLVAPELDGLRIGAWSAVASPEERQAMLDGLADGCRTSELNTKARFGTAVVRLNRASDAIGARRLVIDSGLVPSLRELPTLEDNPRHGGKPIYDVRWTPVVPTGRMPQLRHRGLGSKRAREAFSWKLHPGAEREIRPAVALGLEDQAAGMLAGSGNLRLDWRE